MTADRALKQNVRARLATTGEKYTEARRAVLVEAADAEFDRQVATLVALGHPRAARLSQNALQALVEPLRAPARTLAADADLKAGRFGFAIVLSGAVIPAATAITLVRRQGQPAILSMLEPEELERVAPVEGAEPPHREAHLIADVETGRYRNVTPDAALAEIRAAGRAPLTVEEGIAIATHFPEVVAPNGGFSLAGSRCGDRCVTALWISKGAPKLGWCWAGNPHTWLGTASCAHRIG